MATAETILVVVIVAAMTVLVGRRMWRTLSGKGETCGGCSRSCAVVASPDGLRRGGRQPALAQEKDEFGVDKSVKSC